MRRCVQRIRRSSPTARKVCSEPHGLPQAAEQHTKRQDARQRAGNEAEPGEKSKKTTSNSSDQDTLGLLCDLYSRLCARWPTVFGREPSGFHPHITLGTSAPSAEQLASLLGSTSAASKPHGLSFPLTHMYILRKNSAKKDARFQVIHRVPLFAAAASAPTAAAAASSSAAAVASTSQNNLSQQVISALSSIPGVEGVSWHVGGSRAFDELARRTFGGAGLEGQRQETDEEMSWRRAADPSSSSAASAASDVDVVAILPLHFPSSPGVFLSHLAKHLGSPGPFLCVKLIPGRHESYVKALWKLTAGVDVHVVRREELIGEGNSASAAVDSSASAAGDLDALMASCTSAAPHNFSPVRESHTIWHLLVTSLRQRLFLRSRRIVVSAAKRAQVYGASGGYLPGISWTILVAAMITRWKEEELPKDAETVSEKEILQRFSESYGSAAAFEVPITVLPRSSSEGKHTEGVAADTGSDSASAAASSNGVRRTASPAPVGGSSGFCDRLMQILTCSDAGSPRNTVRALTAATKRVLLAEIAACFDGHTLLQPFGVSLLASSELAHYEQLVECHGWMQEKLPQLGVKMSQQVADLRPCPLSDIAPVQISSAEQAENASASASYASAAEPSRDDLSESLSLSFSWRVLHATNTTAVHLYINRLIHQMRGLFPYVALELQHLQQQQQQQAGK